MATNPPTATLATLERLRAKWGLENDNDRSNLIAAVLENQDKHFKQLAEETRGLVFPDTWHEKIGDALKAQLQAHPLPDLCSTQPMLGPIGIILWYQPKTGGTVEITVTNQTTGKPTQVTVPEIRLKIADQDICAETRRVKSLIGDISVLDLAVEEFLTEITREILGTMLNIALLPSNTDLVSEDCDLLEELSRTSNRVHQRTQRMPANRVIGNEETLVKLGISVPISNGQVQKVGTLGEGPTSKTVYLDPLFPKSHLMTWYQGGMLDTGIVYSPYTMVTVTPNFVDPNGMSLRRAIRTRHKITVVRPEFFRVIKTPEAVDLATTRTA